mgnify:CR=1 FL=1
MDLLILALNRTHSVESSRDADLWERLELPTERMRCLEKTSQGHYSGYCLTLLHLQNSLEKDSFFVSFPISKATSIGSNQNSRCIRLKEIVHFRTLQLTALSCSCQTELN